MRIPYWLLILWTLLVFFLGAIGHEADLSRNYKVEENAHAWIWEIKK